MERERPTGVLLVNLGTPDSPDTGAVRRYLREFLWDPRVIDLPALPRWLLLNLIILPFRPSKSAALYRTIWTDAGSPLLVHGNALRDAVAEALGPDYAVELGMRYGRPSIAAAIDTLMRRDPVRLIVLPLFPQYSSAATGSAVQRVLDEVSAAWNTPPLVIKESFYDHPGFIDASVEIARAALADFGADHVLFSYHGVPVRHVTRSETGVIDCDRTSPCPAVGPTNRYCYRAQCYATTAALVAALGLENTSTAFQSRLGRTPWIQPYTDHVIPQLARSGVKRLAVVEPSFVADCLETLEEIGVRAREQFLAGGGEELVLVPSLNAHPSWVRAVAAMVSESQQRGHETSGRSDQAAGRGE